MTKGILRQENERRKRQVEEYRRERYENRFSFKTIKDDFLRTIKLIFLSIIVCSVIVVILYLFSLTQ
jgi:hypothetical protein